MHPRHLSSLPGIAPKNGAQRQRWAGASTFQEIVETMAGLLLCCKKERIGDSGSNSGIEMLPNLAGARIPAMYDN